jgi:replication factor C subunit 3/5
MSNLRIILCANSTSRLIAPIKSRCLLMRVAAPSHEEMLTVLNHVAKRAGAGSLPADRADEIISDANGNMRKAILVFEAMKMQSYVDTRLCSTKDSSRGLDIGLTYQARSR